MSKIYICRCGEMTEPCWSCVNQTCNNLRECNKDLERQLAEARGFADELIRKLILNKEGSLSNKEVVLSLFNYFEDQLAEKDKEIERLKEVLEDIMQCVEHLGMNSSDGHTLSWVDELCTGVENR